MKNYRLIVPGIVLACALAACKAEAEKCISYVPAPVVAVEGATSGNINEDIPLTVSFGCFNGCGQFGSIQESSNGDTTIINVVAKYEGCICTQDAPVRQVAYLFRRSQPGVYPLKFMQYNNNYTLHTITVQ
ncbi:MAG: hypothetical protein QM687_05300 [Ferruginibacter sp.]